MVRREFLVGSIWTAKEIAFDNDCGGTHLDDKHVWTFMVTRSFYDYECGTRLIGNVTTDEQRALLKTLGRTGCGEDKGYNPTTIYVSEFDIIAPA